MKNFAAFLATALLTVAYASMPAAAQQKTVLKASDVHAAGYPTVVAVENLGKKLEQATNGRVSVQMYPAMQLGGEKEAIEQAQIGAIAFARVSVGALGPVVDDLNVFNMPYVFRNTAHMQQVIDGPIGQELLDKVTNSGKGLIGLCWMDAGARNFYDTKKPIKTVADLKGLKIRVIGNPIFVDMANAMGGNGVAMGYDQVFSALQTGVVDGAENNPPSFVFDNHYQVAKFYTIDEHLIVPEMLVFSKKTWDAMSKEDQALLLEVRQGSTAGRAQALGWPTSSRPWTRPRPPASRSSRCLTPTRRPSRTRSSRCGTNTVPNTPTWSSASRKRSNGTHPIRGIGEMNAIAASFRKAMDALYFVCVLIAGTALVLISAVIPWAVYTRYVLNSAASWPEPAAVLLTICADLFRRRGLLPARHRI